MVAGPVVFKNVPQRQSRSRLNSWQPGRLIATCGAVSVLIPEMRYDVSAVIVAQSEIQKINCCDEGL